MSHPLPDLRQIRAFVAVSDTGNFTKASERLFVTQSAVSHSIRVLEEQLDTKLIERCGKKIALTQAGKVYLRRCRASLHELEAAHEELDVLKNWGQGRIRIGTTYSLSKHLLPTALRKVRDKYPRCEIHIESGDTAELLELLNQSKVDIVLALETRVPQWLHFRQLFRDELSFVISPSHPWRNMKEAPVKLMEREAYLVYTRKSETYRLAKESFEKLGLRLRSSLCVGSMEAIKEMSKAGIGVGILALWTAYEALEAGELIGVRMGPAPPIRSWGIYTRETKSLSEQEDYFTSACIAWAQNLATSHSPPQ